MLVSLSWLKEYVPIKMPLPKLLDRLTEAGIGVEAIHKKEEDTIIEFEITPNRPDLLSIIGIARETAAIQRTTVKIPKATIPKAKKHLPITIKVDYRLSPRVSTVIIDNVKVKDSPLWLVERLLSINQRPINNIVDITNFVMFELGNPLHAFDYDQIKGHMMTVKDAQGGEAFVSVDNIAYKLPKGAIIIKDSQHIIDLCGIKGGLNSGITSRTKRVLLWAAVDDKVAIRKTTQALSLRSEAASIYERGVNRGGTLDALSRTASLILDLAGGNIASNVFDLKKGQFNPWQVTLSLSHLSKLLGYPIEKEKVLKILILLNLSPLTLARPPAGQNKRGDELIKVTVPTYRNDLQIEEDVIEEVARLYGYNKLPKTLSQAEVPKETIPYASGFEKELAIRRLMAALAFSEANTYGLVSIEDLGLVGTHADRIIHIANPVSSEFCALRPSLLVNLLKAVPQNLKHRDAVDLFELGRIYKKEGNQASETLSLAGVRFPSDFFDMKGAIEALFEKLAIPIRFAPIDPMLPFSSSKSAGVFKGKEPLGTLGEVSKKVLRILAIEKTATCFELNLDMILKLIPTANVFIPIAKYPPVVEDLSLVVDKAILTGDLAEEMKMASPLLVAVDFLDAYETTRTFRLTFQDPKKNLSNPEVSIIRNRILNHLKTKFGAELKG